MHIIRHIDALKQFGLPILVGHSEKSFMQLFTDKPAGERQTETLTISHYLIRKNIDYIRIHDVAAHHAMQRTLSALEHDTTPHAKSA